MLYLTGISDLGAPLENIIINNFDVEKSSIGMGGHIGLQPDISLRYIGSGIYFSDMAEQSIYYCLKPRYLGTGTDFVILVCEVTLGRCYEMERTKETYNCSKYNGYDSHSTYYRQGDKVGHEYCIFDSEQILPVCRLHLKVA